VVLKNKVLNKMAYKLVVNDPLDEPGWIIFIIGITKCSFNSCLHHGDVDVFLRFEGLDGMRDLCPHIVTRKPERMLCKKSNN
jgi:hypothetical protein